MTLGRKIGVFLSEIVSRWLKKKGSASPTSEAFRDYVTRKV